MWKMKATAAETERETVAESAAALAWTEEAIVSVMTMITKKTGRLWWSWRCNVDDDAGVSGCNNDDDGDDDDDDDEEEHYDDDANDDDDRTKSITDD